MNAQVDDDASTITIDSQEIAISTMLEKARKALNQTDFKEAQRIISSAAEIASDSTLIQRTQLLQIEYHINCNQLVVAQKELDKIAATSTTNKENLLKIAFLKAILNLKLNKSNVAESSLNSVDQKILNSISKELELEYDFIKGMVFLANDKNLEAIDLFKKILPYTVSENLTFLEANSLLQLARGYVNNDEFEEATLFLEKSLAIAEANGFRELQLESVYLNAQIQKELGNPQKGLEDLISYTDLKKELDLKKEQSGADLSEITRLKTELNQASREATRHDYTNIMFFGIITLLTLLVVSFYMNNRLRAKSNQVLRNTNIALTEERDRATDAAKIKSDFLATITHELRTPMYAVTGLTHLLLEDNPRNNQIEHLETLKSSGDYLLSLIDNILDFNKLEANKMVLESIPFSLKKRIEDLTISLSEQARKHNNNLYIEFDDQIPSRLKGDPVKISQIIINLLSNAIKFTNNGNIWIRANKVNIIANRCLVHFEIEDNGKGISKEKQEMIFDNFSQEETSTTREYGGTGLGLAIVKNLTSLMQSEIKLDSKLGRGSIFYFDIWFDLPNSNQFFETQENLETFGKKPVNTIVTQPTVDAKNLDKTSNNPIKKEVITKREAQPADLVDKKILIVEDNKVNQMITRKILQGKNFSCDVANDGSEAVSKIREQDYDLILMDIHMPIMDGKQATREIRTFNTEIPIIALTAVALKESEKELYEIGFDDIIPKPFKMDDFFSTIQKAFSNYEIL